MKQPFRPRFWSDQELWKKVIDLARLIGPKAAAQRLNSVASDGDQRIVEQKKDGTVGLEYKGRRSITTLDEAIAFFEVDLEQFEVTGYRVNSWDVTNKDGTTYTNYQVRVDLKPAAPCLRRFKESLLQTILPIDLKQIVSPTPESSSQEKKLAVELVIADLHLGKIGFDTVTMEHNWTIKETREAYERVISDVLSKVKPTEIDRFILPVGNDLLNIDTPANMTTKGTPQMTAEFWENLFVIAHEMVTASILTLSQVAPVYVYFVPGNHDRNSTFSLGEVVKARFATNPRVIVDNSPVGRKYHRFGNTLLGYVHGDEGKTKDLYQMMSLDRPQDFAATKYRHYRMGHLHKNRKDRLVKDENYGVELEICPSLSPTDRWHYDNLFIGNMRRSKTFIHHREEGLVQELYLNL